MPRNLYQGMLLPMRQLNSLDLLWALQDIGIIRNKCFCCHCSHVMFLHPVKTMDGYRWRCNNIGCEKYGTTTSVRAGSFFEKHRFSMVDILTAIYYWCNKEPVTRTEAYLNQTRKTVSAVYDHCRLVVNSFLANNPILLGGPGVICQIDESAFTHKCKAHRGRAPEKTVWVFGIVDTSFKPARGYMEIVPDRSRETLLPIIGRICRPGTEIHSDEWGAYRLIQERLGFEHKTVNHSACFVNPDNGVHTQNIESYWAKHKHMLKSMKGIRRGKLPIYLQECTWRDMVENHAFLNFLKLIEIN